MAAPDARLRFPPTAIDFDADVGITGQDHDNYPRPGDQPRYDWMRMYLIALLSHQAAAEAPAQFREGTLWFNLEQLMFEVRSDEAWRSVAECIKVAETDEGVITSLAAWYESVAGRLASLAPTATFSGYCQTSGGIRVIPIPAAQRAAGLGTKPFIWINGLLIDPRLTAYGGPAAAPTSVQLTGAAVLNVDDTFTVVLMPIGSANFSVADVVV